VIAIMTFAMLIVSSAGLALVNAAGAVAAAVEHRYVLQLPDGGNGKLESALRTARSTPGVTNVAAVPEEEMRSTLERWIGPGALGAELPVPALIHLDIAPNVNPKELGSLLERAVPGAGFIAERSTVQPLLGSLRALQLLALMLVLLMAAATSAAVVLAARGALDTHRSTIDIMHGIGATDEQIARLFQRKIALDSIVGALVGGAAAAIVLALIAGGGAVMSRDFTGRMPLGGRDVMLLMLLPLVTVALATLVARTAVLSALRKAP
jgi:cell division transport system permease protein